MAETSAPNANATPRSPTTPANAGRNIDAGAAIAAGLPAAMGSGEPTAGTSPTPAGATPGANLGAVAPEVGKLVQEAVKIALAEQAKTVKAEADRIAAATQVSAARDEFLAKNAPKLPGIYATRYVPKTGEPAALAAGVKAGVDAWMADMRASGGLPAVSGAGGNSAAMNPMQSGQAEAERQARAYRSGNAAIDAIAAHLNRPGPPLADVERQQQRQQRLQADAGSRQK